MVGPRLNLAMVVLALTLAVLGFVGFFSPVCVPFAVRETDWGVLHFFDGRVRLFWMQSPEAPIVVEPYGYGPSFRARSKFRELPELPEGEPGPRLPRIEPPVRVRIGDRRTVPDFGGRFKWNPVRMSATAPPVQVTYVRMPVWLPVGLLLIMPIQWVRSRVWLKRYRMKRQQCIHCGYSVLHLPEPRCPECGAAIDHTGATQ
jgi:hypothetical protein